MHKSKRVLVVFGSLMRAKPAECSTTYQVTIFKIRQFSYGRPFSRHLLPCVQHSLIYYSRVRGSKFEHICKLSLPMAHASSKLDDIQQSIIKTLSLKLDQAERLYTLHTK